MKVHDYEKLEVWKKSLDLVEDVYRLTSRFPKEEVYGLTNQIRRAAVSIPSNVAEGSRRGTNKDFAQFLRVAMGSASELETQLQIADRLQYASTEEIRRELRGILKMLNKLVGTLIV